jgi:hypothetical protein
VVDIHFTKPGAGSVMISLRIGPGLLAVLLAVGSQVQAGTTYRITSTDGKESMEYNVDFGGGKLFEKYTAFDPKSKKFVYLSWERDEPAPKPAGTIWDHRSGELIRLYKFPKVDQPLPVIPSINDLKVCPFTGDKKFKAVPSVVFD